MLTTIPLLPGVTLRCIRDQRFKHGCLSVQLVRPMCREEAAMNALLPAVLLRGCRSCRDLRDITLRLDDLYGASIGTHVRRVGDWQTTGLYASFLEDRFAMDGDRVFAPVADFLRQLLLEPDLSGGVFREDYVQSEKRNLIATIEAQQNDKQAYAMARLMGQLCARDPNGIPRLGEKAWVEAITPRSLYDHYRRILRESRVDLFYVGSEEAQTVARLLRPLFAGLERCPVALPPQSPWNPAPAGDFSETQEVSQGKLCMGFVTPVTIRDEGFAAMQVCNLVLGGGMTGKLFMHLREKLSLCYAIGSGYLGSKGIVTVSAGIDPRQEENVRREILGQLEAICRGEITPAELRSAKEAIRSSLEATHDSPGSMESYYGSAALSGLTLTPEEYRREVEAVTAEKVAAMARTLRLNTTFFLKGVSQ